MVPDPDNARRPAVRRRKPLTVSFWIATALFLFYVLPHLLWPGPLFFRRSDWEQVAVRSEPLIRAIDSFAIDHGEPPPTLESLVPKYLNRIPSPGAPNKKPYVYKRHHPVPDDYGNTFTLRISALRGLNFDEFLYHPSGNYPLDEGGNTYERIGKWEYYHE